MKRLIVLLAAASLLIVPTNTFAQDDEPEETVYDFEAENIDGALVRPDGEQITGDQRGRTSSLIDIREDFIPEMLESVEELE